MSLTGYQKHAIDRQVLQMDEKIIFGNEQKIIFGNEQIFFFLYYYYYSPSAVRLSLSTVHILSFYTVLNEDPNHLYGGLSSL